MSRTVIVTGGSKGLGADLVAGFLAEGDNVATNSRSRTERIDEWEEAFGDRFLYRAFGMADQAAGAAFVKEIVDRWGAIDVLVNNAGVARDGVLALFPDNQIDEVISTNLVSTIRFTKTVSRRMLAKGSGTIINISSIIGLSGYRGLSVYAATKAALDGFTRSLSRELAPRGITVNSVAPGYLRTEMTHGMDEGQLNQIIRRTPMGRLGTPEDVWGPIRFLCSPAASFITGQVLVVDGGLTG